jgi:hypothetical protein
MHSHAEREERSGSDFKPRDDALWHSGRQKTLLLNCRATAVLNIEASNFSRTHCSG